MAGRFSVRESLLGAWGGGRDLDGVDAISSPAANIANTAPPEVIEAEYPLAVDAYAFAPDSGGAGTHRGGLALMRELRYCGERGSFYLRADRQRFRPYPLAGGCPGTPAPRLPGARRGRTQAAGKGLGRAAAR